MVAAMIRAGRRRARGLPFTRQMLLLQVGVVAALGIASVIVAVVVLRATTSEQYEQRALAVARTVAADKGLGDLVAAKDQPAVQALATSQAKATGALFVVVTDRNGVRLAHPNSAEIGKVVSTDPREALSGKEVTSISRGTLGLSARGKVPLRDSSGVIVGEVSVGFAAQQVDTEIDRVLAGAVPWVVAAVAMALLLTAALGRRLKRLTFGLEPAEVADLVREREAVLHGIGEGVLAIDPQQRVTMSNSEANRLLDNEIRPGQTLDELPLSAGVRRALTSADSDRMPVIAVSGERVLVVAHRPVTLDGADLGSVLTLRDRTDLEQLTSELAAVRNLTGALRAQRHEFANRMHMVIGLLHTGSVQDTLEYLSESEDFNAAEFISTTEAVQSNTIRAFIAAKTSYAAEAGVVLRISEDSWLPRKLVAPAEVITVLGNLVDNAVEAAGESTVRPAHVEVDLLVEQDTLVLSVANTGDGIPLDRTSTIFLGGVSSKGPDRGMGLAMAAQTARSLGGDLSLAHPGGSGSETVFVAHLPNVLATTSIEENS